MSGRSALFAVLFAALVCSSSVAGAAVGTSALLDGSQTDASDPTPAGMSSTPTGTDATNASDGGATDGADGSNASLPGNGKSAAVSSRLRARLGEAESGEDVGAAGVDGAPEMVEVVVEAAPGRGDGAAEAVSASNGRVTARHGELVQARVPRKAVDALSASKGVQFVRLPYRPDANAVTSEGIETMNATRMHEQNVTGENVTVAVIDLQGFDLENSEIKGQVVDHRDFTGKGIGNGTDGRHGTAVAELVADTAPGASLVTLRASSLVQWHNAVDYLRTETETDVVVMSMSYYGVGPLDGTSEMNREISGLRDDGILWVNSAGNAADDDHWNGTWNDPDGDGWMNVAGEDETIRLDSGSKANVWMNWNDWDEKDEDYDLYVLNEGGDISGTLNEGAIVGGSTNVQDGSSANPVEVYSNYSVDGPLHLAIRSDGADNTASFDVWFRGNVDPQYATDARSVTNPGVGPNVTTVGAVGYDDAQIEWFSSRGPTIDGRLKPDLVAPDGVSTSAYGGSFYGTSAAAPHAAGVAALLVDVNGNLGPDGIEAALTDTAVSVGGGEPDSTYGYGLVDAAAAVRSQSPLTNVSPETLTYGSVHLTRNETRTVAVANEGDRPLNITAVEVTGDDAAAFAVSSGGDPGTIDPGASRDIAVEFDAAERGTQSATLSIDHNGSDAPTAVSLSGETVAPNISVSAAEGLDFGTVSLRTGESTASVTVENTGSAPLNVTDASISGPDADAYALGREPGARSAIVDPGKTATYEVTVSVDSAGTRTAFLEFAHNVSDADAINRTMSATGADRNPPLAETSRATAADGGSVVGRNGTVTVAVRARDESGVESATVDATALGGGTVPLTAEENDWYNATVSVDAANATEGVRALPIAVTDANGRVNDTETNDLAVDLTNATLSVDSPERNAARNETAVDVAVAADDSLSGVGAVSVRVDGGDWTDATRTDSTWHREVTSLSEGTHSVSVRATDAAGNVGPVVTRTVAVDTSPPVVDSARLDATEGLLPGEAVPVAATASDEQLSVTSVTVDGTPLVDESGTWEGTVAARPALGRHTVPVRATDRAGNANETTVAYDVGENATLARIEGSRYRASPDDPGIGNVTINATADVAGRNVTVGTADANPTPIRPPNDTALAYPQVESDISGDDIANATVEVHLSKAKIDERFVRPTSIAVWTYDGDGWVPAEATRVGETNSTVVYDLRADRLSTFAVTAEVDETAPKVTGRTPSDGETVTDADPTIGATYADDFAGVDASSVTLAVDGATVASGLSAASSSSVSDAPTLEAGTHSVTLSVADAAGNTRTTSWSFTVDPETTEAPDGGGGGTLSSGGGGAPAPPAPTQTETPTPTAAPSTLGADGSATVDLGSEADVRSVAVSVPGGSGDVAVEAVTDLPDGTPETNGRRIATVDISAPDPTDGEATVTMTVSRSRIDDAGADPENLAVEHYDGDSWEQLETTVSASGSDYVLEARTGGFSMYAVTERRDRRTATSATAATATPTGTDEPITTASSAAESTAAPRAESAAAPSARGTPAPDDAPGPILLGGLVVVALALAAALYITYGRE